MRVTDILWSDTPFPKSKSHSFLVVILVIIVIAMLMITLYTLFEAFELTIDKLLEPLKLRP